MIYHVNIPPAVKLRVDPRAGRVEVVRLEVMVA